MSTPERFEAWALLEVMGHKQFAGRVTETTVAGAGFIRIDVPEVVLDGGRTLPAFTKLFAPGSLYAITPMGEDEARAMAASLCEKPIETWRLPQLRALPPAAIDAAPDDEDV